MDRTVPRTGSEEIELYMRTYYSLMRSTHTIQIETLVESHMAMDSSLHVHARSPIPDISTLVYSTTRLPSVMNDINMVVIGQLEKSFIDAGFDVMSWERVYAPGRRRRTHYDGAQMLAVFIASRSDIDDLMPLLTAYQIEWNKIHDLLRSESAYKFLSRIPADHTEELTEADYAALAKVLQVEEVDLRRLALVMPGGLVPILHQIAAERKHIGVKLIAGSLADYRRGTTSWWAEVQNDLRDVVDFAQRRVYFVSSNTHAIINLLTGFARRSEAEIIRYLEAYNQTELVAKYHTLKSGAADEWNLDNFLYYVLKKYLAANGDAPLATLAEDERTSGIWRVPSRHGFDIETQVIELNKLNASWLDGRIVDGLDLSFLAESDALIFNIDYPLGLAAYELLSRVIENVDHLHGVYVMGKSATLNGRIGDIMIPNVVHDEHSQNTYLFNNCFAASDLVPYMREGMVLDNQKAISALGTFLQNGRYMRVFYQEGYTDIEMEAGPYLSSIYEAVRPQRHPQNEIVNLYSAPFDIGFLHYASDTPMSKGHNLGAGTLSYGGVEPTYATATAIMRRILQQEAPYLRQVQR